MMVAIARRRRHHLRGLVAAVLRQTKVILAKNPITAALATGTTLGATPSPVAPPDDDQMAQAVPETARRIATHPTNSPAGCAG